MRLRLLGKMSHDWYWPKLSQTEAQAKVSVDNEICVTETRLGLQ